MSYYNKIRSRFGHHEVGVPSTAAHAQDCTEGFVVRLGRQPKLEGKLRWALGLRWLKTPPTQAINLAVVVKNHARTAANPMHFVCWQEIKRPKAEYKQANPEEQRNNQT